MLEKFTPLALILIAIGANAAVSLSGLVVIDQLSQKIFYINPIDDKKYYLGASHIDPEVVRRVSIGISDKQLSKIPVGWLGYNEKDSDGDGLADSFERVLRTDPSNKDSDGDRFDDKTEVINSFNPLGKGKMAIDTSFATKQSGKIFIAVENRGSLWYVSPNGNKRYYLGKTAIENFKSLKSLGSDKLAYRLSYYQSGIDPKTDQNPNTESQMKKAASAIRSKDKTALLKLFTPELKRSINYTFDYLKTDEKKFLWAGIYESMRLSSETATEKIYKAQVYFGMAGKNVSVEYRETKQPDGTWLISGI